MISNARALLFAILAASLSLAQAAGEALPEQLQQIESLQRRADKLAFGELGANNYHLAKARSWLDLALGEYHENEGIGIVPSAIEQAESLLDALEKKQTGISMDTPQQLPGSETVRPDLWNKIAALKKNDKFSCGQRPIAEAEIQLVWAGHEKLESGWEHAQSYARSAEDLIYEAQASINGCTPVIERITMSTDALFAFDQTTLATPSLPLLDRLADRIKKINALEEVMLVGHTDRLRSDGHPERNQLISEQRAESIRQYLIGKGIPADKIHTSGAGATQPIVECSTRMSKAKQAECLQPNRRVEIILRGAK
jgi:outer membrane protein OmpA-like peptidoglycan-associated protein